MLADGAAHGEGEGAARSAADNVQPARRSPRGWPRARRAEEPRPAGLQTQAPRFESGSAAPFRRRTTSPKEASSTSSDEGIEKRVRAMEVALQAGGRLLDAATERRLRALEDALQALEQRLDEPTAAANGYTAQAYRPVGQEVATLEKSERPPTGRDDPQLTDDPTTDETRRGSRTSAGNRSRHPVTPYVLDCGDKFTANESVWDTMIFFGHGSIGSTNSLMLGGIWALNLALQTMFIVIIIKILMEDTNIDAEMLDGLLKFRLGLAHSAEWADTVTKRSLAQQMCSFDAKMHLAGVQMSLFKDLYNHEDGGFIAQCLVVFTQILWLCTILRDIENTINIFSAVSHVNRGSKTRMVIVDVEEEAVEDAQVPPAPPVSTLIKSHTTYDDEEHLSAFNKVARLATMHRGRVVFVAFFVCLPKLLVASSLWWFGAKWLAQTINFSDLILNGVALAFVLEFDEVLYSVLMPRRTKTLIANLESLPVRPRSPGSSLSGVTTALMIAFVTATIWLFYVFVISQINWQVKEGHAIVCSGDQNFIYTINPATTMVHIAKTTSDDAYTDTEEIIAQVTQVELTESNEWEGRVSQSLFEASRSTFARAVDEGDDFDHVVSMTYWSVSDAAGVLPCRDLGSGDTTAASLQQLRVLTGDSTITSCDNVSSYLCSVMDNYWLRAICPAHCRCEEPLLNNVGFFMDPSFGCPSQCATFKGAKSEIAFRFELSTVEWGSASRRLNATQGSNGTQNATQGSQVSSSNSTASEGDYDDDVEISSALPSCSDLDSAEFHFAGGCADSNGETNLDMNGDDCTIYSVALSLCGERDDEDFSAAEMCCACGGGRQDVLSSASCWDSFVDECWYIPPNPRAFLLYARGLFEYLTSLSGFKDGVTEVVTEDYVGIDPTDDQKADLIDHVSNGSLGRALVDGNWELSPGLAHPRGLTGCDFLASYEVTSLLNLDLCSDGVHGPLRFFCPDACGCDSSYSISECPVACILTDCLTENASCAHVHPWYSDECLAGYHNDGGLPTCMKCTGGETRRRRATSCTDCPDGFFDEGNLDDCEQCLEGATRRRRSTSCTDCGPGSYDAGDSDECTTCYGGATTRRRSTSCVECAVGSYNLGGEEDDCQSCSGVSTSRRRASNVTECLSGYYNDGSSDDCSQCGGAYGETRRRRAETCTDCKAGYSSSEGEDDCSPVDCPSNSVGDSVYEGCWCDVGYAGEIRAVEDAPYYSGECAELPVYIRTSGFCDIPILNADLCAKAAQMVGIRRIYEPELVIDRDSEEYVLRGTSYSADYSSEPTGCYETPDDDLMMYINSAGDNECSSSYRCVCLGYEYDFECTDASGKFATTTTTCPNTSNISFDATEDCSYSQRELCCGCGGGDLEKLANNGCVDLDDLSLSAPITEGTPGAADSESEEEPSSTISCIMFDWAPSKCERSYYYETEDFAADSMCCSCGGGTYDTTQTTVSRVETTTGTTTDSATDTTTETSTSTNV